MSYAAVYRNFIYPTYHRLKNDGVLQAQKDIDAFMAGSPDERAYTQRNKLSALLKHAYTNIPFYRQRFGGAGIDPHNPVEQFDKIPPLTKSDIRQNINAIRIPPSNDSIRLIQNSTSGSTGEKLVFHFDRYCEAMRKATVLFDYRQLGLQNGTKIAKLWGAPMDIDMASSIRGRMHSMLTRQVILSTYQLSDAHMEAYADRLQDFKPKLLISYPSPLAAFCDFLQKSNRSFPSIKFILTSAEQLFNWQREKIERTFNCPVMNRYGCREFGDIAHEFPNERGLHLHSFRFHLEILDEHNQPVEKGESGHIHITDLDNYGMPFIRYRIEDDATWRNSGHAETAYGLPVLAAIDGRSFDVVEAPNGNRIGGTYWTILLRSQPGIKQFQLIQNRKDHIIINYIPEGDNSSSNFSESTRTYLIDLIQDKCGRTMKVTFNQVDALVQTASGKKRLVISRLS